MADIDLSSFKSLYFQTAKEYITSLEGAIGLLMQNPSDEKAINDAFIASHSLKSQSSVMGYMEASQLAGVLEKSFRVYKTHEKVITSEVLPVLTEAVSHLRESILALEAGGSEKEMHTVREKIRIIVGLKEK